MATPPLHKPKTTVGDYKIVEVAGRDSRASLYLAEKSDPEFRYWLMEFVEPLPPRAVGEDQELFEWGGRSLFSMPVAGTTAASLPQFVRQRAWQFLTPRFAKAAEEMAVRHDKGQLYQTRGPLSLENFFFNADGTMSLYPGSRHSASSILPPEGAANPSPAADVYVVASALKRLVEPPPGEKPLLKSNPTLDAVLARATQPDPNDRYATAAGLALALNAVAPSSLVSADENGMPWLSGCVVPAVILLVLAAVAFGAYNGVAGRARAETQATATTLRAGNLVMATAPASAPVTLEDLSIDAAEEGALRATLRLRQGEEALSAVTPRFTVVHNDEVVDGVRSEPLDGGRYALTFATALATDNVFRVVAAVGDQNASGTLYLFNSDVTGIDYGTGDIAPAGLPPAPSGIESRHGEPAPVGDPFDFPDLFDLFRLEPEAEETGLPYMSDMIVQADATGHPRMNTYVSFRNSAGFPARLGGRVNIRLFQDGAEVPRFELAPVQPGEDPLTAVLMIDVSGSMEGDPIAQARAAAEEFVNRLRPTDRACLYIFATQVTLAQPCTSDHAATITAVRELRTVDDTSLHDALIRVAADQRAVPGRQAIIVLSDGADTVSQATLEEALAAIRQTNAPLYLIGLVSEQFDGAVLQRLAAETSGLYLQTPSAGQLDDLYLLARVQLDNQYRFSFDSLFPERTSGTLTFRFTDGDTLLEKTKPYFAP